MAAGIETPPQAAELSFGQPTADVLSIRLSGNWRLEDVRPSADGLAKELESGRIRHVTFDTTGLGEWDTGLITFLTQIHSRFKDRGIEFDGAGLPEGARRLIALAFAVPVELDTPILEA